MLVIVLILTYHVINISLRIGYLKDFIFQVEVEVWDVVHRLEKLGVIQLVEVEVIQLAEVEVIQLVEVEVSQLVEVEVIQLVGVAGIQLEGVRWDRVQEAEVHQEP